MEGIHEETELLMFAGYDTTTTTLCYTLGFVTENPEIYHKCLDEIDNVLGSATRPTMDMLRDLKYLEACIKESLRLRPPSPEWFRTKPDGGHLTIKQTQHYIDPSAPIFNVTHIIHTDPTHFVEPEKYHPERFMMSDKKRHPFSFIPFSAGARNCIGQKFAMVEIKVVMVILLRSFKFKPKQVRLDAHYPCSNYTSGHL